MWQSQKGQMFRYLITGWEPDDTPWFKSWMPRFVSRVVCYILVCGPVWCSKKKLFTNVFEDKRLRHAMQHWLTEPDWKSLTLARLSVWNYGTLLIDEDGGPAASGIATQHRAEAMVHHWALKGTVLLPGTRNTGHLKWLQVWHAPISQTHHIWTAASWLSTNIWITPRIAK